MENESTDNNSVNRDDETSSSSTVDEEGSSDAANDNATDHLGLKSAATHPTALTYVATDYSSTTSDDD